MKFWISKKKGTKITIHLQDEIDYKEIEYPLKFDSSFYDYRQSITQSLIEGAIAKWLDENGAELFEKLDTDEALKELKKKLMFNMIGK